MKKLIVQPLSESDAELLASRVGQWETTLAFEGFTKRVSRMDGGELVALVTELPEYPCKMCEIWDTRPGFTITFEGTTWDSGPESPRRVYEGPATIAF